MPDIKRKVIKPDKLTQPSVYPYSQAVRVRAGELLFIAGQPAIDANAGTVGVGDMAAQTRQVYANIGAALESAGVDFSHVVELTTFIVGRENLDAHRVTLLWLYKEYFPDGDYPPDTVVLVDGLYREEFLLEVKAIAVLP